MPALRVGLVGPLPPPSGGMARQTEQLAQLLSQTGVQVSLVRTNLPYRPVWVARIKGLRALFRLCHYFVLLLRTVPRVDLLHLMANSGWSWHLFAAPAIWVAYWHKVPVVLNYRGGEAEKFFSHSWHWVKYSVTRVQEVLVPSPFLQQVFAGYEVKAKVVPNLLDLSQFHRLCREELPEAGTSGPHLIVTRNLEHIYGIDTVIAAFALIRKSMPNARMSVAGSGPEKERLIKIIESLGLSDSIQLLGRLTHDEMAELYQSADLMLNGSREDNSPNSLIEALASGIPVVSTNVGGIPFLINSGVNGLLVSPNDAHVMAEAALKLLQDKETAARIVAQGLEDVKRFDQTKVIEQLMTIYREAVS